MPVRGEGLVEEDENALGRPASPSRDSEETIYVLHPNCAVEEM